MAKNLNKQDEEHNNSLSGKICITAQGDDLRSEIDPHFGRALYFLIIDPDSSNFEAIQNPSVHQAHGAGIQSAQLLLDKGVSVLITGQVGPNAQRVLESARIKIITGESGPAEQALARFKSQAKK
ncbi:MAG: NifB/NifX family molybdenum-iron cluster-binding protein [Candidatus Aminicenantes bacterium]|nr:NifB/NifX family molybdenum-iron cluster-binding protein [Candidatus Aminicenantes bacterium]